MLGAFSRLTAVITWLSFRTLAELNPWSGGAGDDVLSNVLLILPQILRTIALLVLVVVWSLLGMTIAQTPWLANSGLLQAIFYVVAGLGWVLPAMPIVSWMSRPDRAA